MASIRPPFWPQQLKQYWGFLFVSLIVVGLVTNDPYISSFVPISVWQKLRMIDFPFKATVAIPFVVLLLTCILHFALQARDSRTVLLVLMIVALQTNGIKFPLDLISVLPFIVVFFLLAESLMCPSHQIVVPGLIFGAVLLLLLDLPYMANLTIYGPVRFIINFISVLKAMLVAFAFVNLIRTERHLHIAVKAIIAVAVISATIGVGQWMLDYFTGIRINFLDEHAEIKPTFIGTGFRASGLTTWPSWLSDYLALALPFMLFRLCDASTFWRRAAYVIAILILLGGILFTFTYAAYFSAGIVIFLFPFVYCPRKTVHFLVTLLFLGAIAYSLGGIDWLLDHALQKVTLSSGMVERKVYLQAAIDELTRHPWLGSGFYAEEGFSENFFRKRVHNTGIQAWVDLGLPGLLVFVTMTLTVFTQLWLLVFSSRKAFRRIFQALGLGMIAMIVEMFAEPNFSAPVNWFYLGLSQAAILVYCSSHYHKRLPNLAMQKAT